MNKKIMFLIISAFILLSFTPVSNAQKPEINIDISPQEQWLGQPVNITATITSDSEILLAKINIQHENENTTLYYNAIMKKASDNTFYWNATYEEAGTYKFFIWTKDKDGDENTSILYTFTIVDNHPPNIPSNPSPQDNASNVNIDVTLSWNCSDEDVGDILTYDIYFGTNSTPPKVKTNHTNTSYKPEIQYGKVYYWRIVAKDSHGATTTGPIWHFETIPNHKPNTPSKPSGPNSGYTNTSYSFSTSTTDPEGNKIRYYFSWGDGTGEWTNYVHSGETVSISHVWTRAGSYQVKVKAQDEEGAESEWSPSKTITITEKPPQPENNPPDTPNKPTGPIMGYTNISYNYSTKTTDPDNDQVYYLFDWGDGTNTGWLGPYNSSTAISKIHSWDKPGTYEVKARAKDTNNAESQWSQTLTVTIYQQTVNNPPNKPTISGPTTGYINHAYNYTITATDPDNDNIKYFIDWGDQTTQQTTFENSGSVITVSHTWTKKGFYLVRVKAIDSNNAESLWSDTLSINIQGAEAIEDSDNDGIPDSIDLQPHIPQNTRKTTIENQEFYLIDSDNDNIYEQLYNKQTNIINYLGRENGNYLLDVDNDGKWDYTYNPATNTAKTYEEYTGETIPWNLILIAICVIIAIIIIAIVFSRKKEKTMTPIVENIAETTVACPNCKRLIKVQGKPGSTVPVKCPSCGTKGIAKI
ncbi:MAG: PKD domain-containing protein [Thermoplasmata archaeon]|nr:PKD domain-containing protein [Thermoplasmata archaeon]